LQQQNSDLKMACLINGLLSVSETKKVRLDKLPDGGYSIDMRVYENGQPSLKGINLDIAQFRFLNDLLPMIQAALENFHHQESYTPLKLDLGDNVFATVARPFRCVNIRKYFVPRGGFMPIPTRQGITFFFDGEFSEFKKCMQLADDAIMASVLVPPFYANIDVVD
jgi:hypothetical protein